MLSSIIYDPNPTNTCGRDWSNFAYLLCTTINTRQRIKTFAKKRVLACTVHCRVGFQVNQAWLYKEIYIFVLLCQKHASFISREKEGPLLLHNKTFICIKTTCRFLKKPAFMVYHKVSSWLFYARTKCIFILDTKFKKWFSIKLQSYQEKLLISLAHWEGKFFRGKAD